MLHLEGDIVHLRRTRLGEDGQVEIASVGVKREAEDRACNVVRIRRVVREGVSEQGRRVRHTVRQQQELAANVVIFVLYELVVAVEAGIGRIVDVVFADVVFGGDAHGELVLDERRIDHEGRAARVHRADGRLALCFPIKGRVLRLDIDRTRKRRAARERGLGAAIDLDLLDIPEAARTTARAHDGLLRAVDIEASKRRAAGRETFGVHAANDETGIRPVAVHDVAHHAERATETLDLMVLDFLRSDDADARRGVFERGGVLRAVDDEGRKRGGAADFRHAAERNDIGARELVGKTRAREKRGKRLAGGVAAREAAGRQARDFIRGEKDLQVRLIGKRSERAIKALGGDGKRDGNCRNAFSRLGHCPKGREPAHQGGNGDTRRQTLQPVPAGNPRIHRNPLRSSTRKTTGSGAAAPRFRDDEREEGILQGLREKNRVGRKSANQRDKGETGDADRQDEFHGGQQLFRPFEIEDARDFETPKIIREDKDAFGHEAGDLLHHGAEGTPVEDELAAPPGKLRAGIGRGEAEGALARRHEERLVRPDHGGAAAGGLGLDLAGGDGEAGGHAILVEAAKREDGAGRACGAAFRDDGEGPGRNRRDLEESLSAMERHAALRVIEIQGDGTAGVQPEARPVRQVGAAALALRGFEIGMRGEELLRAEAAKGQHGGSSKAARKKVTAGKREAAPRAKGAGRGGARPFKTVEGGCFRPAQILPEGFRPGGGRLMQRAFGAPGREGITKLRRRLAAAQPRDPIEGFVLQRCLFFPFGRQKPLIVHARAALPPRERRHRTIMSVRG